MIHTLIPGQNKTWCGLKAKKHHKHDPILATCAKCLKISAKHNKPLRFNNPPTYVKEEDMKTANSKQVVNKLLAQLGAKTIWESDGSITSLNNQKKSTLYEQWYADLPKKEKWSWDTRRKGILQFAWAIPNAEAIKEIVKYSPIVEVGAGKGYWSFEVKRFGGDIITTDPDALSYVSKESRPEAKIWQEPLKMDSLDAVAKYPDRNVMMVWPCHGKTWAAEAIKQMRVGQFLIYVGEDHGGCTGSDEFFDILSRNFQEILSLRIPQWEAIHDHLWIYKRVKGKSQS